MRSELNRDFLKKQLKIAQRTSLAGLALFAVGMYLTFAVPQAVTWAFVALILGFLVSQVGIYFGNRYGRQPRVDQVLDQALKGLGEKHVLYHYATPAGHVIIGPSGVWVLVVKYQQGRIRYRKGKWRQSGGPVLWYLRLFAQEGLGRPDVEIAEEVKLVRRALEEHLGPEEAAQIPVEPVLVFTSPKAQLEDVADAPVPTLKPEALKGFFRERLKQKRLTPEQVKRVREALVLAPAAGKKGEEGTDNKAAGKKKARSRA